MSQSGFDHDRFFEREWAEVEQGLTTMASKMFLPGFTTEDILSEFKIAAYEAVRHWAAYSDGRASFRTMIWKIAFNKRVTLIREYTTQMRDHTKEDRFKSVDVTGASQQGEAETGATRGTANFVVVEDDFAKAVEESIGNAGRYSMINMLKSVDKIGKSVLICLAASMTINETCWFIRRYRTAEEIEAATGAKNGEFHRAEFQKVRKQLQRNPELHAMMTA
jgi:DNA-directed RNA polymerase specialized sigma24 family protein